MQINNFTDVKSLFLENKTLRQTLFKNTFWLAAAEGITKILKLVLLIYVARILGATEYGKFSFAFAFVSLFTVFFTLGLPPIIIRELSQEKEKEKDFLSLLSLRILLSFGTLILIFIGSFFITLDPLVRNIIWILALYTILDSFAGFLNHFFRARQKMEYESWGKIFRTILLTGFGLFILFIFPSVENLSYSYLFAALISLIFILLFFHLKALPLKLSWNKIIWQRYLFMSWPIALSGIFVVIYGQVDSVIMGYLKQITETGFYNAAYRIAGAALIPIGLISTSFYPVLSKTFKESKEQFQNVWNNLMEIMIFFTLPIIIGGIVLAPKIIGFIYGPSFSSSILAFQILIIMAGITFLHNPFNQVLFIFNQQKKIFWIYLLGATMNLILNIILIPRYSLYGAAAASAITSFSVLLAYVGLTLSFPSVKIFNLKLLEMGALTGFSALIMYLVISRFYIYNLHFAYSLIIGAITYVLVFFSLRQSKKYFSNFLFNDKI